MICCAEVFFVFVTGLDFTELFTGANISSVSLTPLSLTPRSQKNCLGNLSRVLFINEKKQYHKLLVTFVDSKFQRYFSANLKKKKTSLLLCQGCSQDLSDFKKWMG